MKLSFDQCQHDAWCIFICDQCDYYDKHQSKVKKEPTNTFRKMAAPNVCRYYKYGYCRFGEVWRKIYID